MSLLLCFRLLSLFHLTLCMSAHHRLTHVFRNLRRLLTGTTISSEADAYSACCRLHESGVEVVIITSLWGDWVPQDQIFIMASQRNGTRAQVVGYVHHCDMIDMVHVISPVAGQSKHVATSYSVLMVPKIPGMVMRARSLQWVNLLRIRATLHCAVQVEWWALGTWPLPCWWDGYIERKIYLKQSMPRE